MEVVFLGVDFCDVVRTDLYPGFLDAFNISKKILHQNCKNNAILVQYWFCILPDARNQNGRSSVSAPAASKSVGAGAGACDG